MDPQGTPINPNFVARGDETTKQKGNDSLTRMPDDGKEHVNS
jgi:hypothetical protein